MINNIAIIGSSGAIGSAFTKQLSIMYPGAKIHAFSRGKPKVSDLNIKYYSIDYNDENSIKESALIASNEILLDMIIIATGVLHYDQVKPEKGLRDLSAKNFQLIFEANTILPALIAKHFIPRLNRDKRVVFAALSARVGSISDNQLGGWYAYRASKSALNMIIKNTAIEFARRNKQAIIVGLHPGTVDSDLSKPFQGNVADGKLFTPDLSAQKMISVLKHLTPISSGKCYAWDGQEIEP